MNTKMSGYLLLITGAPVLLGLILYRILAEQIPVPSLALGSIAMIASVTAIIKGVDNIFPPHS